MTSAASIAPPLAISLAMFEKSAFFISTVRPSLHVIWMKVTEPVCAMPRYSEEQIISSAGWRVMT